MSKTMRQCIVVVLVFTLLCLATVLNPNLQLFDTQANSNVDASEQQENSSIEVPEQTVEDLIELALDETNTRIDNYIDVDYFSNLQENNTSSSQIVRFSTESSYDNSISQYQYDALTSSITQIFDELSEEEYSTFETLAQEESDIADMLEMVNNGFNTYEDAQSNIVTFSAALTTIAGILTAQKVCTAAIVAIKGAFSSMVATLKAFFLPTTLKAIIVTAAILVIATVVIINWSKIKQVFNQIVNVFVENAKALAATVTKVFNTIKGMTTTSILDSISSYDGSTITYEKSTTKEKVDTKVITAVKSSSIDEKKAVYYFAYAGNTTFVKFEQYPLNYVEAVSVLYITGLYNKAGSIETSFFLIHSFDSLSETAKKLIEALAKGGSINRNLAGIYTPSIEDAGRLALVCGATNISVMEIHGTDSWYYWHFHSGNHAFHIWFSK